MSAVNVHDISVKTIKGQEKKLEDYAGKVTLIVNVASQCGLTPQYTGLEELYREYKDKGFTIVGFPCNDFAGQEPGTNEEIENFACGRYNVTFDLMDKIHTKGAEQHPLYTRLVTVEPAGDISWNFEKFLVDRQGNVIHRYSPRTEPGQIAEDIEKELAK